MSAAALPTVAAPAVAAQTAPTVAASAVTTPLITTMAAQPVTYLSSQGQVTYAQTPVTLPSTLPSTTSYVYNYAAPVQTVVVGSTAAYFPGSVQAAWDNHFKAFGDQDLDKIMLDYDETSVARVYNNADGKKVEFTGLTAIRGMFEQLFKDLPDLKTLEAPIIDVDAAGNQVFLVWKCPGCGFDTATDTFIFGPDFKIKRQNIVITKKSEPKVVKKTKKGCW